MGECEYCGKEERFVVSNSYNINVSNIQGVRCKYCKTMVRVCNKCERFKVIKCLQCRRDEKLNDILDG